MGKMKSTSTRLALLLHAPSLRRRAGLLAICWLLAAGSLAGQAAKLKKAEQQYRAGNFSAAIELYHPLAEKDGLPEAKLGLAESYRQIGDFHAAAQWYAQAVSLPECQAEHKLHYALSLLQLDRCEAAQEVLTDYLKLKPYDARRAEFSAVCAQQERLRHKLKGQAEVELMPFNSPYADFAPAFYKEGVVFTSERETDNRGRRFTKLFVVSRSEDAYSAPELFAGTFNARFHQGTATFNQDFSEIYFTRTRYLESPDKLNRLEISSARRLAVGGWSELAALPISSDDFSVAHPALSPDGKRLYFSSDRPGGFGGRDLYYSSFENGQWGAPVNLGPAVNTAGDEVFPFAAADGKLYFSSDGHFGLGGQDIFWSREQDEGLWGKPENLGYPINTEHDDFSFILAPDGAAGYFTSNRPGGIGGDDIYFFRKTGRLAQVDLVDLDSGEPIAGARLWDACTQSERQADANGRLYLRLPECCTLTGKAEGYQERALEACPEEGKPIADTLFIALALELRSPTDEIAAPALPAQEAAAAAPGVLAAIPSSGGTMLQGTVFSQATGKPIFQAQLKLFGSKCSDPPIVSTDRQGRFAIPLEAGCCYQVRAERDSYFSKNLDKKICLQADNAPAALNIFLTPYAIDAASEGEGASVDASQEEAAFGFKSKSGEDSSLSFTVNVYYDTGRSSVRSESVPELVKLLHLLQDNPEIILEISSHTDANGSDLFNQQLSQRRADAVVKYLVGKGIQRERLIAIGHGESRLSNHCADGVPCTEEEHAENRRTEFRVVGRLSF
jgi:outer membrane protein OmpA-like peptidoglycan-associated protein/tetratricopeptide (TPR) repeat protein